MEFSSFVFSALMALLVVSAVGRSPVPSPSISPETPPRVDTPTPSPAVKSPASSPAPPPVTAPSPPSPLSSSSPAPALPPSISSPPSDAPGPAPVNSAVLNRFNVVGFMAAGLFGAVLVM